MTEYKPFSWNGQPITDERLNQMVGNTQYLFDHASAIRYSANGLTRDTALKIIVGKTPVEARTDRNYNFTNIYFGSFFTAGCKPIVVGTIEGTGGSHHRAHHVIQSLTAGSEIDHNGFIAITSTEAIKTWAAAWFHWTAFGY